jgi:ABC-type phosphate transport system auxiliary subunit
MKDDVRKKLGKQSSSSSFFVKYELVRVLNLASELETVYKTYPKLQSVVGHQAWQELTDVVYRDLLRLNLDNANLQLRQDISENFRRLEDISASTLVRDHHALRDTLARVLRYRITNGLTEVR